MPGPDATIEPGTFPVYEDVSFEVLIDPHVELSPGSTVECQLPNSFGATDVSPTSPKEFQIDDPDGRDYVSVSADGGATFDIGFEDREFVGGARAPTRHGTCLTATVESGGVAASEPVRVGYHNTTSPWIADQQPDGSLHEGTVFVRVDGERVVPAPTFEVQPDEAAYHRLLVPSSATPGASFQARLVSLDPYNNVSRSTYDGVSLRVDDAVIAADIAFTGRHEESVTLSEPGIHRLTADLPDHEPVRSNPVRVTDDDAGPYWGDIHVHSDPSVDAMGNVPYEYARHVSGLDFAATAEHGAVGLAPYWERTRTNAREWNEPGAFVAIPAFETNMTPSFEDVRGVHMNVYLYDDIDCAPIDRMADGNSFVSAPELDAFLDSKDALTQIHHTGWGFDMRRQYHETTDLFEIYSMHGTSELYDPDSSIFMDKHRAEAGVASEGPYYARDAWALGQRFSTHGSSDNHFGQPGVRYNSVTAAQADALTRASVLDAMSSGRCYATTGERILLEFTVDGEPMGSELERPPGDDVTVGVEVHGTGPIEAVEVFSCPVLEPDDPVEFGEFRFEDGDERVDAARREWETEFSVDGVDALDVEAEWEAPVTAGTTVRYVRVSQAEPIELPAPIEGQDEPQVRDVHAWSTPIWVVPP